MSMLSVSSGRMIHRPLLYYFILERSVRCGVLVKYRNSQ